MDDLRSHERIETSLQARIVPDGGDPVVCLIRDISDTGAKIEVDVALTLPPEFDLSILGTGETVHAEIRWRYGHKVGVRFVRPDADATQEPSREMLASENRKLWEALETLAKRLTQLGEHVVLPPELIRGPGAKELAPVKETVPGRRAALAV